MTKKYRHKKDKFRIHSDQCTFILDNQIEVLAGGFLEKTLSFSVPTLVDLQMCQQDSYQMEIPIYLC